MSVFDDKAQERADFIKATEQRQETIYDDNEANLAAVHSREDLALVVSYVSSVVGQLALINGQLKATNILLGSIFLVLCLKALFI